MKRILLFIVMLRFDIDPEKASALYDERSKKLVSGIDLLKQNRYQEARIVFEASLEEDPANAMTHFYLGDAGRGLKAWACAEEHYQPSLELDAQSSVADLAKQRGRKAKVWRLLDEGQQAINESNPLANQVAHAENILGIAHKLGLDDEQGALFNQLHEKIQQQHTRSPEKTVSTKHLERSMVLVPAGKFIMGSVMGDPDEQPVHYVYLDAFHMDKHELSVGEYARFLESTSHTAPPEWNIMSKSIHQKRPVINVDWADADAYCKWADKRLPTEAEWEKAARGIDGRIYPWGNELPTQSHANMKKEVWNNHMVVTPVGMFEDGKSPYGIL